MQEIEAFLAKILPYLRTKREHAKLMLELVRNRLKKGYSETLDKKEITLYNRIKELNQK